jgi:hypothetical protein
MVSINLLPFMRSICFVYARNEERACLERNIALYAHLFDEVVVLTPEDSPINLEGFNCVRVGMSGHSGEISIRRAMHGMQYASSFDYDIYAFTEYDGVFVKAPDYFDGMQTNVHVDKDVQRWGVDFYCHSPIIFSKKWLKVFVDGMKLDARGEYYGDRWLANQVKDLNIPIRNLMATGEGYSQNTIDERFEEDFKRALDAGAYALHGIKDKRILDLCYNALK